MQNVWVQEVRLFEKQKNKKKMCFKNYKMYQLIVLPAQ